MSCSGQDVYRKLDESVREIRVLDLLNFTGKENECLRCCLRHVSLDTRPEPSYETISYCWGDPDPTETILLNDRAFRIPKNTYLALRRCSYPDRSRTIWIDAVCINQKDIQERSQQVEMMGAIYSQTSTGLIYLGEGGPGSSKVFASLDSVATEAREVCSREQLREMTIPERRPWATNAKYLRSPFDVWDTRELFECPWFRRLWVLQEAVLPSRSVCLYGDSQICLDTLLDATIWLSYHFPYIGVPLQNCKGREAARRAWNLRTMNSRTGVFAQLMTSTRETLTSDPRDRVFGLLGMIDKSEATSGLLRSDYAKSVSEVIRDGVRYCIEVEQYPFIWRELSHRCQKEVEDAEWPSWVPRMNRPWSDTEDPVELPHNEGDVPRQDAPRTNEEVKHPQDPNILRLRGVIVDTIVKITDTLFVMPHTTEKLHDSLQEVLKLIDHPAEYDLALQRTLTAGLDYRRQRYDQDCKAEFLAFVGWTSGHHDAGVAYVQITPDSEDVGVRSSRYYSALDGACPNRRFCITEGGHYGLMPQVCRAGDIVVMMGILRRPVALRPKDDGQYSLLGECYLDGFMWPEEIERVENEEREEVIFEIR